jgi:protein-S-isoprenylcysteine O-methyltransferase Ste14
MSARFLFDLLLLSSLAAAAVTALFLLFVSAPYGRHVRKGWGATMDNRLGWIVMEAPAPLVFALFFLSGEHRNTLTALVFLIMWEAHYIHRSFIYPFGLRSEGKRMPLVIAGMGFLFNALNGYLNGRWLFTFSGGYANDWLLEPRFVLGLSLFITGFVINRHADRTLRHLRENGESGYTVPRGGMYRWISCPNYFGEIVEWIGWSIATWSLAGLAFAVWTAANLVPRARSHHKWYQESFADYPPERKALVPRLW